MIIIRRVLCAICLLSMMLLLASSSLKAQDDQRGNTSGNSNLRKEGQSGRAHQAEIIRTLVYHEITSLTGAVSTGGLEAPILSANGNRAVFAIAPGTQDPARPNRIFVINADGTGQTEVDSYTTLCFCGSQVDISADGSKVISSDPVQLRIANADGSGQQTLVRLTDLAFLAIRISGDGSKVFFLLYRDAGILNPPQVLPVGVYVINPDGTGLRQVVGREQVANYLGISVDRVAGLGNNPTSLSVSHDGSRIVFTAYVDVQSGGAGQQLFGINLDGTGLVSLVDRQGFFASGISADGVKVAYHFSAFDGRSEVGIVNFDGMQRRPLVSKAYIDPSPFPTGFPDLFGDRLQLSADGSKLFLGSTGVLLETATGAALQLAGTPFSGGPSPVASNEMFRATMNGSATRFLYLASDANGVRQLATLDINPASLGAAPSVTNPMINPSFVLTNFRSTATITARVSTTNTVTGVGGVSLLNGLYDRNVPPPDNAGQVMFDDGTNGDVTAGDGVFTKNNWSAPADAVVGPRVVRVKAEVKAGDGKRHATAVDFEPFAVENPTAVEERQSGNLPDGFALSANFPNPFNPETMIRYQIAKGKGKPTQVSLRIFNTLGQEVRTLVESKQETGVYEVIWDGRDDTGKSLPSGIYLYRLVAGDFQQTRKMTLLQ